MSRSRFQLQQMALQARLFRGLARRKVDASVLIEAFMNSRVAEGLDARYDRMQWAGEEYLYECVVDEAGLRRVDKPVRHSPDVLFYAGYIYRYWHFLTGESSREIYRQANAEQILSSYGYHTESNELAVRDLKAAHGNNVLSHNSIE